MQGTDVVTDIVEIIGSGIVALAQKIGAGVSALVNNLWFTTTGEGSSATTTMSVFAVMVCVFAGIGLAIGLSRLIFNWLGSLGGSR